jgi:hypothetical protein
MSIDYEAVLYWKERTLQLLLALDKARDLLDEDEDPQHLFQTIVEVLKEQFRSDACAIIVLAETSDDVDFVANIGFSADEYETLCREALNRTGTGKVSTSKWAHTLGIQVILQDFPLAGLVLARQSEPFSVEEMGLLSIGASQIDSAVIQARLIAKLTQRNRELEAIYQIDRLRDETPTETTLIGGLAGIAFQRFNAELTIIILGDANSGRHVLRSRVESGISQDLLDAIHVRASDISIPQVIPSPDELSDVALLAAPFIVSGERLGAIVIGRRGTFTISDHRLLYAMVSQMDTAVAKNRDLNRRLLSSEGNANAQ